MKNKVGRPKQEIKRNIEVKFLVTEEEYRKLEELESIHGADKSKIIRSAVFALADVSRFSPIIYIHYLDLPVIQKYNKFCLLHRAQIEDFKLKFDPLLYGKDEVL